VPVTAIDIQVDDVPAAVALLRDAYGWEVTADGENFGELVAGDLRIMLSVGAMVPWQRANGLSCTTTSTTWAGDSRSRSTG
jgi:hypothetical protein